MDDITGKITREITRKITGLVIVVIIAQIAAWTGVAWVAVHFISKFW